MTARRLGLIQRLRDLRQLQRDEAARAVEAAEADLARARATSERAVRTHSRLLEEGRAWLPRVASAAELLTFADDRERSAARIREATRIEQAAAGEVDERRRALADRARALRSVERAIERLRAAAAASQRRDEQRASDEHGSRAEPKP